MFLHFSEGWEMCCMALWLFLPTWLEQSTTSPAVIETRASALRVRTGWPVRAERSTVGETVILQPHFFTVPVAGAAALSHNKQTIEKWKKVFGLNGFIIHTIQNDCCVKVLGVSQIIRENPEIINKTDSQNRNIMPDLKQPSKNNCSMKVIKTLWSFLKWALDIWREVLSCRDKVENF